MSLETGAVERRAARLVRAYPRCWRDRYGEEFTDLLCTDFTERPRCRRRTLDVVASGFRTRLSVVGLAHGPVLQPYAALVTAGAAAAGFAAAALSLWVQLVGGWHVVPPDSRAVTVGVLVMSVTGAYLAMLALLAAGPVLAAFANAVRRRRARGLVGPAAVIAVAATVLVLGGVHFASKWPGAGGHSLVWHHLAPGGLAGFGWAETLSISTYWLHPSRLLSTPASQLVWMTVCPIAVAASVAAGVRLMRRLDLSEDAIRFEARLARAAALGMVPCLAAAGAWVISSQADPNAMFRAGTLDLVLIVAMLATLMVVRVVAEGLGNSRRWSLSE